MVKVSDMALHILIWMLTSCTNEIGSAELNYPMEMMHLKLFSLGTLRDQQVQKETASLPEVLKQPIGAALLLLPGT